jgi:hypothetical protein
MRPVVLVAREGVGVSMKCGFSSMFLALKAAMLYVGYENV